MTNSQKMFFRANVGNILTIVIVVLIYFFFRGIKNIPLIYFIFICYIDIWLFKIAFEYQRITLILSRIAKFNNSSQLSIPELQILMTDNFFAFIFFHQFFLSGFIVGYSILNSLVYLILYLLFKYFLCSSIPTYIPFNYLFRLVNRELNRSEITINPIEYFEKSNLKKYFEEMPHNSNYEDWAFDKYGNGLLKVR